MQRETSTEDQIRECRDAARKQGWVVLDNYIRSDEAKSGRSLLGRTGLDDLMALAQQKDCPFDGILLFDTSRLGRNLTDSLRLTDILKYAGVFLYFTTRELDSRDPSFRMLFISYGSKDEEYCVDAAARTHRGQEGQVLKGFVPSGRLFGYENVEVRREEGKQRRHGRGAIEGVKREIIPEQAAVVVRIFEMYVAGAGRHAIAIALNEEGIPSPGMVLGQVRSRWSATTIAQTLSNPKYKGLHIWNQTKVVRNPLTQKKEQQKRPESEWKRVEVPEWRIVTPELWNAAATEKESRWGKTGWKKGGTNRTAESRRYIFAGLLFCEKCGWPFIAFRTARGGVRFACGRWRCGSCSNNTSILLSTVESHLLPAISECLNDTVVRDKLASDYHAQMVSLWSERVDSTKEVVDSEDQLQERRRELRRKAANILDALQDDGRSPLLTERLNGIQKELAEIDAALATVMEVVTPPLPEEETKVLITRKLADLDAALMEQPDIVKHRLSKHVEELLMTLVETPEGPRYEVTGDIRVFARGDTEDVLLASSLQRSFKQYTPLRFPFKATLNPKIDRPRRTKEMEGS